MAFPGAESAGRPSTEPLRTRRPRPEDAGAIRRLVLASGSLDPNSAYAYLLVCTDFADTSLVAERDGRLVGFVAGYRPPRRRDTLFVWQIGVDASARRTGTGAAMLEALLARTDTRDVRFLEATVTPSNAASRALFSGFARRRGAAIAEETAFSADLFCEPDHEAEVRLRIGPMTA